MPARKSDTIYRVYYAKKGEPLCEIHARSVGPSDMLGFIEVSSFVTPRSTSKIIRPGVDRVEQEFAGVEKTYIPISDIRRVDALPAENVPVEDGTLKVVELRPTSSSS